MRLWLTVLGVALLQGCLEPGTRFEGGAREVFVGPSLRVMPSPALAFGPVAAAKTRTLVLRNVGDEALLLLKLALAPATTELALTAAGYDSAKGIAPQASIELEVTLTPASLGPKVLELTIDTNDRAYPSTKIQIIADAVTAEPCSLGVSPARLDFGDGQAGELPLMILNTSTSACELDALSFEPGSSPTYLLAAPFPRRTLRPGESVTAKVRFAPDLAPPASTIQTGTLRLSAPPSTTLVPLSANVSRGCLVAAPDDLSFGTVQQGCSSATRVVALYNVCPAPVTLVSFELSPPAGDPEFLAVLAPANNTILNPGAGPAILKLKYRPNNPGADTGALLIKVKQNGVPVDALVTLAGNGDAAGVNTDTWAQPLRPKADLLFVVDDSPSMLSKQASLITNFTALLRYLDRLDVDYQLALTTTDLGAVGGRILGDAKSPKLLTPDRADRQRELVLKLQSIGASGSSTEQILAAASTALSPALLATDNLGLVRPGAALAVLSVSDSDDESPLTVRDYAALLQRQGKQVSFSAVGPTLALPPAGCSYDGPGGAPRTTAVVAALAGARADICDGLWAAQLEALGKNAFGRQSTFYLTALPDLTGGNPLAVTLDGAALAPATASGAVVWKYDELSNALKFEPAFIPAGGSILKATYSVACLP